MNSDPNYPEDLLYALTAFWGKHWKEAEFGRGTADGSGGSGYGLGDGWACGDGNDYGLGDGWGTGDGSGYLDPSGSWTSPQLDRRLRR